MSKDELLKMLKLDAKEAPSGDDGLGLKPVSGEGLPPGQLYSTALAVDDWGLRRGRELVEESERIQKTGADEFAAADCHAAAFEPDPTLNPACIDPLRGKFMEQLLDTPEYQELHSSTMLNPMASEIAAASFAEQLAKLKEEYKKPVKAKGKAGEMEKEMRVVRAVGKAVEEAEKEVEEARDAEAALGMGEGSPGSNDPKKVAALHRRIRNNPTLRRICELAGRYRRLAQSKQRQKVMHGMDDVVGVVQDGDLGRLLPHELAKLAMPEFEDDTLRRLVERETQCREYQATEPVGKGPILVTVDESGSMNGEPGNTAKALALALAWIARHQKRWCGLIAYSGDSGHRLLALPPGRWNEDQLLDWLQAFIGRGSHLDVPVREMPDFYRQIGAPVGKTDVVMVTDAICHIPSDIEARFNAWRKEVQARVISIIINSPPGDLTQISDEVHQTKSLSVTEDAVERALSL